MAQIRDNIQSEDKNLARHQNAGEARQQLPTLLQFLSQHWLLSILLFATALGFNLYRLGTPSIWFDEAFSVELARQPLPTLWHIIFGPEPNMELYYLFLHFWLAITGAIGINPTEVVVRFPSALFAALSTVVIFLLGRRFLGTAAGIVGAALYLLNDLQLVYAQQTRGYSLQLLLLCVAWYALLSACFSQAHPRRWWVCYVIATALAVYTHLFSLLILVSQVVALAGILLLSGSRKEKMRRAIKVVVSMVTIGVLILPMLILSRQGSKTGWLPIPHLNDVYHLFLTISGQSKLYLLAMVAFCALGLVMAFLFYLPKGRTLLEQFLPINTPDATSTAAVQQWLPTAFALVCWLVLPVAISYMVSQGATRVFSSRYLVTIVPPLCLLVGLGVASLHWRILQAVLCFGLILLALGCVPLYYASAQVEDWNVTSHWLEQHYQNNDGLVCYDNVQGCQISVEYYLHAYPSTAHFTNDTPGAYSWQKYGPADPLYGYEAAVDPTQLAAYGAKHPRLFFISGRIPDDNAAARDKAAQQWLDTHYHYRGQIVTTTVTIRLYDTGKA